MTPEGIAHIDAIKQAAKEAIKGTPLEGSKIYLGGTAATFKDMQDGANYDLLIAGIAALCLIFIIMLIITRSVVAAAVIVGTVVLSLGASFGLSVLIWQHIIGIELHWMVLAMSVIILLAVGADYNLLLVSRFKEEIHAGLNTGIIRAMGGTGSVVTSAGLVFAFTMMSMAVSELTVIGQVGTTIGLGLLFDTLVVRSFMTPSIAALLGKWFWWPQHVRQRPLPEPWPTAGPTEPERVTRYSRTSTLENAEFDRSTLVSPRCLPSVAEAWPRHTSGGRAPVGDRRSLHRRHRRRSYRAKSRHPGPPENRSNS